MGQEQELDEGKANEAMSALTINKNASSDGKDGNDANGSNNNNTTKRKVSKDDVAFIVDELEVTNEVAEKALRDVLDGMVEDGNSELSSASIVTAALRHLIVS